MQQRLIDLVIIIVLFSIVAGAMYYVCKKFELPQMVLWVCGAFLLVVIIVFAFNQTNGISLPALRTSHYSGH